MLEKCTSSEVFVSTGGGGGGGHLKHEGKTKKF
jgi:hypothetical protein